MAQIKKTPDWERIENDYRAGLLSVREIAASQGVSHVAIGKRAKRDGWERDLKAREPVTVEKREKDELDRSGYVYVIYLDDSAGERFYKIGLASSFHARMDAHRCASPFDIKVACAYYVGNMRAEERALHERFSSQRVRGEWFRLVRADLTEIASRAVLI